MPLSEYVQANLAQAFVNVLFGSASVINMIGLQNFDPVVYGLIRAVLTTILLVSLRWDQRLVCCSSNRVQQDDVARFCAAAICLFVGEIFYILGNELAGSIRASLWQPSQPIWTMAITALLGHERMSWRKMLGLLLAFTGCAIMVLGRSSKGQDEKGEVRALLGNLCLFINCSLGTPLYIIAVKPLLNEYPPFAVAGLSFTLNSVCFGITLSLMSLFIADVHQLVPAVDPWSWAAVTYVAIFATVLPYSLQLWATRVLPASLVSSYYVLQPVAASAIVYTLLALRIGTGTLSPGQLSDLGSIAVLIGLAVVVLGTPSPEQVPDDECAALNGEFGEVVSSPEFDAGLRNNIGESRLCDGDDPVYKKVEKCTVEAADSSSASHIPQSRTEVA